MNELYWHHLVKCTHHPFELIVIDNGSTDGGAEFFESVGAKVIRNGANFSYPYCQNRGIEVAQYDWLAFLNNDIIVSEDWDKRMMSSMDINGLDVATSCGVEMMESKNATRKYRRRWNKIKILLSLFGHSKFFLYLTHVFMYGNWKWFYERRYQLFKHQVRQGFVGNAVMMRRSALDKIGLWDERLQAADFDLYYRSIERAQTVGDIKPVHVCLDVFIHHYIRLTTKKDHPPFFDKANLIPIEQKWGKTKMNEHVELLHR